VCVGPAASVFGLDRDPRLEAGAPAAALLLQLLVVELLLEGVRGAVEAAAAREASDAEDGSSSMSSSVESALHGFGESGVLLATACGA
jgi:hypothetical protein